MTAPKTPFRVLLHTALLLACIAAIMPAAHADRNGNYLIITAPDFYNSAALNQFVTFKEGQGFVVNTYCPPDGTSRATIKAYIDSLWGTAQAPDYLLIVGDTDGESASDADSIPHWIGQASRAATTDWPYVCMDAGDDWYPEFPVGRWSVRNTSQLQIVVNKTLAVESGNYPDPDYVLRATFLATNDMTSGAEETHDEVISTIMDPLEFISTKIYARLGGGTSDITAAQNLGNLIMIYFGHSGSSGWSTPSFSQSNVRSLTNDEVFGLVMGFSCNTAHYSYDECFGETWLREEASGCAAYLSASDYIFWGSWEDWEPARQLETYFYKAVFLANQREVGMAWMTALGDFYGDYGSDPANYNVTRNFFEEMVLLGDPSLRLPEPDGFTLDSDPIAQSVCAPDNAYFEIAVGQNGTYAEEVTLGVTGLPSGTTGTFSDATVTPPATVTLTIKNTQNAAPGWYETVKVTGTSVDMARAVVVRLHVGTGAPQPTTLVSPANGATEVDRAPTFSWTAATNGAEYELEVATDLGFTNVVYTTTTSYLSHAMPTRLDSLATYFWRVRSLNGCGESAYSSTYNFTTIDQAEYFTEMFTGGFDLENFSITFIPESSGSHYRMCGEAITELPTDPTGGTVLDMREDNYEAVTLDMSRTVSLYNYSYTTIYVGSNGYLTFNSGESEYTESLNAHFSQPRISALFHDLSSQNGGPCTWMQLEDRAVFTFENVPVYNTSNSNTFQYELFFDGVIRISYLGMDATAAIVGLSAGEGVPEDYIASDLSSAGPCGPPYSIEVTPTSAECCAPADVQFTIDVIDDDGFAEMVTLSVTGEPAGTTVDFTTEAEYPPFTSTLTVGNTGAATPGDYSLVITGTSLSGDRSVVANLNISDGIPATVALLDPADGAIDVEQQPTLTWQAVNQAASYELDVATDSAFSNIVYTASVANPSHTLQDSLDGDTTYYWRVMATNACGDGQVSAAFSFATIDVLLPVSYDLLNGQTGTYTYYDDDYDGDGDNTQPLAPLTNGLGDLTNGVIATQNWDSTPAPYVGWQTIDPTITFHFDEWVMVREIRLYVDDSSSGGVVPPSSVTVEANGQSETFPVSDPTGTAPFAIILDELDFAGTTVDVTLSDGSSSAYMMLSEVEMFGSTCHGDMDVDGDVDLSDLQLLLAAYGSQPGDANWDAVCDINGDEIVNLSDLQMLLTLYGDVCY